MAEKGFGVKEVNLIGASGTPTITSPNNLNLNANNVAISTNVSIGGTLTVTGNVSVGGTLTYEDVTNIDSVGIVTAREGVFIPDNKELKIGNTASSPDLKIYHNTSNTLIENSTGQLSLNNSGGNISVRATDTNGDFILRVGGSTSSENAIVAVHNGEVILSFNGNTKLTTTNTGVTVTGTLTATTFSGSGASLTSLPAANLTGTLPAISGANLTNLPADTPTNSDIQVVYTVTANGSSAYRFAGNGVVSTADNPDLYFIRGQKYRFINNSGGSHPFQIRESSGGSAYSTGVTNNGAASGNIDFAPTYDSPAQLVYQCTSHGGMVGNIYLRDAAGGNTNVGVTTFVADTTFNGVKVGRGAGNDDKSTIVGFLALASNTTGYRNTAIGNQALNANLSGIDNTAIGAYSNRKNTSGNSNTSVGKWTMIQNINGHSNSVFGSNSLGICTSGFRNTIMGFNSGSAIVDGSGNTIIGCNITGSTSLTDTVIIGAGNGIERLRIDSSGDVGLGTSIIENFGGGHVTLEVAGSTTSQGGVFKTATSDSAGTGSSGTEMIMFTDNAKGAINVVSSDPLTFSTANTERVRITSGGSIKVGFINNVNPTTVFDVMASAINQDIVRFTGANYNRGLKISTAASGSINDALIKYDADSQNSAGQHAFLTDGTERLRITSDGKIGIGEDDPDGNYLLIRAASTVGTTKGHIMLTGDSATVGQGPQIVFSESGSGSSFAGAYIGHIREGSNSTGSLVFGTRATGGDANTVPTERLRIMSNGKIGVNATTTALIAPTYTLDLGGNDGVLDTSEQNTLRIRCNNGGTAIRVGSGGGSSQVVLIRVDGHSVGNNCLGETDSSSYGASITYRGDRAGNENSLGIYMDNTTNASQVEALNLRQNGDYIFGGSSYSDRDQKENITSLPGTALDKITQLTPRTWNWKPEYHDIPTDRIFGGFIAQEVLPHIPSIVKGTDGQGDMSLDYQGLLAWTIKALTELKSENDNLKARVNTLESS